MEFYFPIGRIMSTLFKKLYPEGTEDTEGYRKFFLRPSVPSALSVYHPIHDKY